MNTASSFISPIAQAIGKGWSAKEVLDYLIKADKDNGPKIKRAMDAGYSPDEIAEYLSSSYTTSKKAKQEGYRPFGERLTPPKGATQAEMTSLVNQSNQKKGIGGAIGSLAKGALPLVALAGLASRGGPAGIAAGLAGNYIGSKLNSPASSSGTPSAAGPTPQQFSPEPSATAPSAPSTLPQTLGEVAGQIMGAFGFRNKALIEAVKAIAEATGQTIDEVKQDLSKNGDLSTPAKAAETAKAKLKEITGASPPTGKGEEKLKEAKPFSETKKDLAKQLKSSTLRKMNYNSDTKKLELVFNSGAKYQYHDFPEDQWKKLSAGQTPAKTKGKNQFGIWWIGKSPSRGSTFNEIIQPHLRKAGPYQYERIGTEEMTPEEEQELAEVQQPLMKKAQKTLSEAEKAEQAGRKLKGKEKLSQGQINARTRVLTKQAEELRKAPPSERTKKAADLIEQRLQQLADLDSMTKRVKGKVMREEIERFEKEEAGTFLRKLLITLPKNIVKEAKAKTGRLSERNLLKAIRGLIAK